MYKAVQYCNRITENKPQVVITDNYTFNFYCEIEMAIQKRS